MGASLGDPSDLCALLKSQALNSQLSACLPAMVDALRNHVSRCQLMLTLHAQRMSLLEELYEHLKVNTQQRLDTLEQMYFALKRVVLAEADASRKRRRVDQGNESVAMQQHGDVDEQGRDRDAAPSMEEPREQEPSAEAPAVRRGPRQRRKRRKRGG